MKFLSRLALGVGATLLAGSANAAVVFVDLSAAGTGALVTGVGASFAQGFAAGPLALAASGPIHVAAFNPLVSQASNSLLSQPNNATTMAMLFDNGVVVNSLTLTAGSFDGGGVTVTGYDLAGRATGSTILSATRGYAVFTITGIGNFAGVLFSNNTDPGGIRFQNFSYVVETAAVVPEPATWAMLTLGFGMLGGAARRRGVRARYA